MPFKQERFCHGQYRFGTDRQFSRDCLPNAAVRALALRFRPGCKYLRRRKSSRRPPRKNASKDRFPENSAMTTKVLVVDGHAEIYRQRLQAEFPVLQFLLARHPAALPADAADANVLISFAMGLQDEFF